jgi:hypothetical protein
MCYSFSGQEKGIKMRLLSALLFITMLGPLSAAEKARDWKIGKVLDSASDKSVDPTSINPNNGRVGNVYTKSTTLIIQGDDYAYTIEDVKQKTDSLRAHSLIGVALANRKHGCRFIVNEEVEYAQEEKDKTHLYVLDADGKQCKLEILRQEKRQ